ncbi:MAG: hypothetical protein JW748_11845 [Anaerolineales bacterium]|nr:hypothetical protein [Anaerolineales bacterium]
MKTLLVLQPGQRGTRKLLAEHGQRMVCVRYRYDERLKRRLKTVELIISNVAWEPGVPRPGTKVSVRIGYDEADLRRKIKAAGGKWNGKTRVWRIRYDKAVELGLRSRIVGRECI